MAAQPEMHVCDVHRLLDNNKTPRMCIFCNRCQAWICTDDLQRWDRRGRAMIKMWGNKYGPSEPASGGCGNC